MLPNNGPLRRALTLGAIHYVSSLPGPLKHVSKPMFSSHGS